MKLPPDLREFLELAISENVRFLLIGGWAYNRYAEPRFTGDIDLFLDGTPETESLIRQVLSKFGFASTLPPPDVSLFSKKVVMLGRPPNRIDLITDIDGVTFEEAWQDREQDVLDGLVLNYISKANLVRNKKASARPKDLLDVQILMEHDPDG